MCESGHVFSHFLKEVVKNVSCFQHFYFEVYGNWNVFYHFLFAVAKNMSCFAFFWFEMYKNWRVCCQFLFAIAKNMSWFALFWFEMYKNWRVCCHFLFAIARTLHILPFFVPKCSKHDMFLVTAFLLLLKRSTFLQLLLVNVWKQGIFSGQVSRDLRAST